MGANNFIDQFKEKSEHLSVDPSAKLWDRLEDKLDESKKENRVNKLKFLNIAASCALLIGASAFVWFSFFQPNTALAANENFQIEEWNLNESDLKYYNNQNSQREEYRRQLLKLYGSDKASDLKRK